MQIYSPTLKGPLKISGFIDPDDVTKVTVYWGAPVFVPQLIYKVGDICCPSVDNGYYYQCTTSGISGSVEPKWNQEETSSGTAVLTAVSWNLWLLHDEIITDSTWLANNPLIDVATSYYNDYRAEVFVSNVPSTLVDFTLTNQVTKANGEQISRSFIYKVNQQ
jgi:hypothetical protein